MRKNNNTTVCTTLVPSTHLLFDTWNKLPGNVSHQWTWVCREELQCFPYIAVNAAVVTQHHASNGRRRRYTLQTWMLVKCFHPCHNNTTPLTPATAATTTTDGKGNRSTVVCNQHYGNSHAIWDYTVLPNIWQRWQSCLYPSHLKLVLDLSTPEGYKAELT